MTPAFRTLCLTLVCTLVLGATALAGTPQKVKFGRGRTTAVLHGTTRSGKSKSYSLGATSGQTMTLHATSRGKTVTFTVASPSGESLVADTQDWVDQLPSDGNYIITMNTEKSVSQAYTLEVTIR